MAAFAVKPIPRLCSSTVLCTSSTFGDAMMVSSASKHHAPGVQVQNAVVATGRGLFAVHKVALRTRKKVVVVPAKLAGQVVRLVARTPLRLLRSRGGDVEEEGDDDESISACISWGDESLATWPPRSWYLCATKPDVEGAICQMLDEEAPHMAGMGQWACSLPNFQPVEDRGEFYDEMSMLPPTIQALTKSRASLGHKRSPFRFFFSRARASRVRSEK